MLRIMAKLQKLEGEVEFKCSAEKIFQMRNTESDIPKICSNKVPSVFAFQGDWLSVGSTRKWDFIIDGKQESQTDRIESIDEKSMTIRRSIIDGNIMKDYKTLLLQIQVVPKEEKNEGCLVKCCFEYEKVNEFGPDPIQLLNFTLAVLVDLAGSLSP